MRLILNKNCSLRGWKNIPFAVSIDDSPQNPIQITEELCQKLSEPFAYSGGNRLIDTLIYQGVILPCREGETLSERQQYFNYGCLHFGAVIFSITGKCNYKCMHCSVNAPNAPMGEMSMERIQKMLDEMHECGLKNIVLIGGEPLIRRDFLQVVDEVTKRGMFVVQIFTNGSLINQKLLDGLHERNVSPLFMLSFDGVGYHDTMRGIKGAEKIFYEKLKLLRENGETVSCNMCVTKDSIFSIWETVQMLSQYGVRSLTVYPPASCGLWKNKINALGVSANTVADAYEQLVENYTAAGYPLDLNLYGLAYFDSRMKKYVIAPKWRSKKGNANARACATFEQELNISPEGILSPCYAMMSEPFVRETMPDLNKMSLKQALTDSSFTRLMELSIQDILNHNPECAKCEFSSMCGGGCRMQAFEETGDFMGADVRTCDFFKNGTADRLRVAARRGALKRMG